MSKTPTRIASRLAVLALCALLLAGCFRIDLAIHVNDDGSGEMTMLVAFDESLLALMQGQLGGAGADGGASGASGATGDEASGATGDEADPFDLFSGLNEADLPPGVTVSPYNDDGFVGATITFPFEATDDVATSLDEAFAATDESSPLGGASASPLENLILEKEEGGGWHFEADVSSPAADQDGVDADVAQLLLKDATFTVRITLPGEVVETNADERGAGGELIWHVNPAGEDRTLMARTQPGGEAASPLLIAGALIVAVLVVGGAAYWVRRRGSGAGTVGTGAPPPPASPPGDTDAPPAPASPPTDRDAPPPPASPPTDTDAPPPPASPPTDRDAPPPPPPPPPGTV